MAQESGSFAKVCLNLFLQMVVRITLTIMLFVAVGCPRQKPGPDQPVVPKPVPETATTTQS